MARGKMIASTLNITLAYINNSFPQGSKLKRDKKPAVKAITSTCAVQRKLADCNFIVNSFQIKMSMRRYFSNLIPAIQLEPEGNLSLKISFRAKYVAEVSSIDLYNFCLSLSFPPFLH